MPRKPKTSLNDRVTVTITDMEIQRCHRLSTIEIPGSDRPRCRLDMDHKGAHIMTGDRDAVAE